MVIPYGKHTSQDGWILLLKYLVADYGWSPIVVEVVAVQIVVVVTCRWNNIDQSVRDADQLVTLLLHILRVGIAVVPAIHNHVFRLYRCIAIGMSQCTPTHSLFAVTLYETDIVIGKLAELLYNIFLSVGILICTDVYALASKYRVFSLKILLEKSINEFICLRVEEIEVIHAILLRADLWLVLSESKRVCRYINFGYNLHKILFAQDLEVDKLLL